MESPKDSRPRNREGMGRPLHSRDLSERNQSTDQVEAATQRTGQQADLGGSGKGGRQEGGAPEARAPGQPPAPCFPRALHLLRGRCSLLSTARALLHRNRFKDRLLQDVSPDLLTPFHSSFSSWGLSCCLVLCWLILMCNCCGSFFFRCMSLSRLVFEAFTSRDSISSLFLRLSTTTGRGLSKGVGRGLSKHQIPESQGTRAGVGGEG